jgi:hypothetical protein
VQFDAELAGQLHRCRIDRRAQYHRSYPAVPGGAEQSGHGSRRYAHPEHDLAAGQLAELCPSGFRIGNADGLGRRQPVEQVGQPLARIGVIHAGDLIRSEQPALAGT